MYEETLLTQIADGYTQNVTTFNTLIQQPPTIELSQTCGSLLQEILEMEALFPEIVMKNSPTQRLSALMTHLGDGVLHTRGGFVDVYSCLNGTSELSKLLGNLPGIIVAATPSLIDLYYVEGMLVKAHLRDSDLTDVLSHCPLLKIPTAWPGEEKIDIRVTVSIIPVDPSESDLNSMMLDGSVITTLQVLFGKFMLPLSDSITNGLFKIVVVDTSRTVPDSLLPDITGVQLELLKNDYTLDKYTPHDLNFIYNRLNTEYFYPNVLFFHNIAGKSAIGVYPTSVRIEPVITAITPVFTTMGQLHHRLDLVAHAPGITTWLPYYDSALDRLHPQCTPYEIGDSFVITSLNSLDPLARELAKKRENKITHCPACQTKLLSTKTGLFCQNNTCPGVVATRLAALSECMYSATITFDIATCRMVTDSIAKANAPHHLAGILTALRGDLRRGALALPLDSDTLTDHTKGRLVILDEILEEIDHVMLSSDRDQFKYNTYLKIILAALGFYYLTRRNIEYLVSAALGQLSAPWQYSVKTLQDAQALKCIGIDHYTAMMIETEAKRRKEELQVLADHFTNA